MNLSKKITFLDGVVVFAFLIFSLYFFKKYYLSFAKDSYEVVVLHKNGVLYSESISKDNLLEFNGVVIEIKNKKVRVLRSDCPYKICVNTGWIEKPYQSITCVPNKIHIKILSKKKLVDGVTY